MNIIIGTVAFILFCVTAYFIAGETRDSLAMEMVGFKLLCGIIAIIEIPVVFLVVAYIASGG